MPISQPGATPTPSSSSTVIVETAQSPAEFLEALIRRRDALSRFKEVPSSRCGSPDCLDGESDSHTMQIAARTQRLREGVDTLLREAGGDPAAGQWAILIQLLTTTTSKAPRDHLRWVPGATGMRQRPKPGPSGWCMPDTEEEWFAWEEKRKKELEEVRRKEGKVTAQMTLKAQLKAKVQSKVKDWQKDLVPSSDIDELSIHSLLEDEPAPPPPTPAPSTRSLKSSLSASANPLGFKVIKRSATRNLIDAKIGKGRPPVRGFSAADASCSREPPAPSDPPQTRISALSEASFLPPSFPKELVTSTPNSKPPKRKPSPIGHTVHMPPSSPLTPLPSSLLPSMPPPASASVNSSSQPSLPSSPLKNKRPREPAQAGPSKKARIDQDVDMRPPASPPPVAVLAEAPLTPMKRGLPTLSELLSSSKCKPSSSSPKKQHTKIGSPHPLPERMAEPEPDSDVAEDVGEATVLAADDKPPSEMFEADDDDIPGFSRFDPPLTSAQAADAVVRPTARKVKADDESTRSHVAVQTSEPPKPVAPLTFIGLDDFVPPLTSTQKDGAGESQGDLFATDSQGLFGASQAAGVFYNSQFDVEACIDDGSRFMASDVDLYDRTPWPDDDE
ncbi:hypothetical protein FISHEDRAFT_59010 [Fistulina hepatica ATCC 64428]|uniref:Uncharacterized protein n=1 Tax=Fistulina hepatica ATCC 64428 TaxID=1128425 RepID=A0A0D7AAY4_9AGAR|nr:hypothetical protein FISHEDRAFT_59010 [Fistulina hepatica ATCC 64428]